MNSKDAYWFPCSPSFRWPVGFVGAGFIITAILRLLHADYGTAIVGLIFGGMMLRAFFITPQLRPYSKGDKLIRKLVIGALLFTIAALALAIFPSILTFR